MTPELLIAIAELCRLSIGADAFYSAMKSGILREQLTCQKRLIQCVREAPKKQAADAVGDCVLSTVQN